jgi:hypothetical protein
MLFNQTTFIGIDPTAGHKPFVYAALDVELRLLALGKGSMDEVLAFLAGQRSAFVAVSAPRRPNQGLMEKKQVRESLSPVPRPGRWTNFRVAEYQLRQHNISSPQTPSEVSQSNNWMKMGFSLFNRMELLGYCPFPHEDSSLQSLEVYPHACFSVLIGRTPFPKNTLEGRLQRQLILHQCNLRISDPMLFFEEITAHRLIQGKLPLEDLYQQEELDALVSAYTAYLAGVHSEKTSLLGDPLEGYLVLPSAELKRRY